MIKILQIFLWKFIAQKKHNLTVITDLYNKPIVRFNIK